jgi:Asp-tRNA(Asn)/Glu-tRNA(Gln) amidotransferase C subunit|tara:strand:+ start:295 stop:477 length:183 start_codon:yes stop_codon:yes gene_type:complete
MEDLTHEDIKILAKASNIAIPDELIAEIGYSLNGLLQTLQQINQPRIEEVEPLPIVIPTI